MAGNNSGIRNNQMEQQMKGAQAAGGKDPKNQGQGDRDSGNQERGGRRDDQRRDRGGERPRGGRGTFIPEQQMDQIASAVARRLPQVGREIGPQNKNPENQMAKMITELGTACIAMRIAANELKKYIVSSDTETAATTEEKERIRTLLTSISSWADTVAFNASKAENTFKEMQEHMARARVNAAEILWETEDIDERILKLPEADSPQWKRLERAKNELRKFIGDADAVVPLAASPLRPTTNEPRLPGVEKEATRDNPPMKKLQSLLTKNDVEGFRTWHKEYIEGSGIDTYRTNNTNTAIKEEEMRLMKEGMLAPLAEIMPVLMQKKYTTVEDNNRMTSLRTTYTAVAEALSGNPQPGSLGEQLLVNMSVESIKEHIALLQPQIKAIEEELTAPGVTVSDEKMVIAVDLIDKMMGERKEITAVTLAQESAGALTEQEAEKIIADLS